ncbi:MAG: MMPL family transporter [Planctomycetes bacterium]|nr:MMPL family transporter [Planctomycetota bacterium]
MSSYGRSLLRGWWAILLAFAALAAWAGTLLPDFSVEAGTDVLLNEDDPDLAYYNESRADWAYDEYVIVCCHRKEGWFSPEAMALLRDFTDRLERVPHAKTVLGITKVPLLRNVPGALLPVPVTLVDPKGELDARVNLEKAKKELLGHTQAVGNLISANGQDTSILVYLDLPEDIVVTEPERMRLMARREDAEAQKRLHEVVEPRFKAGKVELNRRREMFVNVIRELAREWSPKFDEPVRLSGLSHININLLEHIRSDLSTFGVASFALFTLALLLIYRRPRWVALPMVACALPVVVILAVMVSADRKVTVITSNLPVLLFVLMLPYSVYFVERYRERRTLYPDEDPKVSTARAPMEIWIPCLYSCTTTMAGTASLMTSGINPVRTFGLMMTVGMAMGLATIMLFLPSAHLSLPGVTVTGAGAASELGGPLKALVALCLRRPAVVLGASVALLAVSIWGATRLKVETKFIDYFRPSSEIYQGLDYIDNRMGGTTPLEVILESDVKRRLECETCAKVVAPADLDGEKKCRACGKKPKERPGFFETPAGLAAIEAVGRFFDTVPETGNVRSFKTLVDEVRKAVKMKEEPLIRTVASMAKEQAAEFCNRDFSVSRVLVRMKETAPTLNRNRILAGLRVHLASLQEKELKGVRARPTGIFLLYANMLNSLIESQKDTFLMVVGAIFTMLCVLFRNPLLAAIVLVPQVLPVFVVLGVMGFAGVPLDMVTVMIASVAMGVGIDAAIQYTVRYRIELAATGGDVAQAIRRSHATIGRAIMIATSIVFTGFVILALSRFVPTMYFGLFTGLAMLMGLLASLTALPSAFVVLRYPRIRRADGGR